MEHLQKLSANLSKKMSIVDSLNKKLSISNSLIVICLQGLNVQEVTNLRKILNNVGITLYVVKNTLAKRATENTAFQELNFLFTGPTAIVYSNENIIVAKNIVDFAKDNVKVKILGGMIDKKLVDVESIKAIASLPSLDELRAKIIGIINSPARNIARVMKAPSEKLVRVFGAYANKE